jgi:hypothetical protein
MTPYTPAGLNKRRPAWLGAMVICILLGACSGDSESNTGAPVPRYWLSLLGASPDGFFRSLTYTYSHDNAIMAVARRIVIAEPDVLDFHRKSLRAVTNYGRTHKLEIRLRFKLKTRDYFSDFQTGLRQVPSQFGSALHPVSMFFTVSLYLALAVFAIGTVYKIATWFTRKVGVTGREFTPSSAREPLFAAYSACCSAPG